MFTGVEDFVLALKRGEEVPRDQIIFLDQVDLFGRNFPVFAVYCRPDQKTDGSIYVVCIGLLRDGGKTTLELFWHVTYFVDDQHESRLDNPLASGEGLRDEVRQDFLSRDSIYFDAFSRSIMRMMLFGVTGE